MNELWSRIFAAWDNLSPRERALLSVMGGTAAVFVFALLVVNPLLNAVSRGSERIDGDNPKPIRQRARQLGTMAN